MKLAILGSSPQSLEVALRFHQHGAALTWFNAPEIEYEEQFEDLHTPLSYTTDAGLALLAELGKVYAPSKFSWQSYKELYYGPLAAYLGQEQKNRPHEVMSLSKRYLAPSEEIPGKTRFHDLFRIIFKVNPEDFIKEQAETNPETYARLSEEFKTSLQTNLEMYEDFDVVIDCRRRQKETSLSITGRALGESRVSRDQLIYGHQVYKVAQAINADAGDVREIAVIGSSALAAALTVELADWLKDQRSRLFVISAESWPFEKILTEAHPQIATELTKLISHMEQEFQKEVDEFHQRLREWQALDDFIQAKKPKPVEPIPRLVFFSGHNATAVDQLIDKRRLFLTLEKPDFRDGHKQPENNGLDLKTIGVDRILVATDFKKNDIENYLSNSEKGFFALDLTLPLMKEAWQQDLEGIRGIENEIFKLFSPVGAH